MPSVCNYFLLVLLVFSGLSFSLNSAHAACGATNIYTDDGGNSTYWNSTAIWSPTNVPNNSNENAIISAAGNQGYTWVYPGSYTVGCVEVLSGILAMWNQTLTVTGDYFRSHNPSGVYYGRTDNRIIMNGTAPQTFEVVDIIPNLDINGNNTVTFTHPFKTLNAFTLPAASTATVYIDADYEIINNNAFTIPAGATVHVRNGAKFTSNGNVTVNGSLIIESGSSIFMGNGRTLSVPAGGYIKIEGSPANVGTIDSDGTFTFNVSGTVDFDYFRVSHMNGSGLNVSNGTIGQMNNGEFHYMPSGGSAVTLGATATVAPVWESVGFFNDAGHATNYNVNATSWTAGSASAITINNWNGDKGGEAHDRDSLCGADPPGCVAWGTEAATALAISNNTAPGNPPATLGAPSAETLWGTIAFSLTSADTPTDITQLVLTQTGTAIASEVGEVRIYVDNGANNCTYQNTDTLIGNAYLSGNPQTATFNFAAGEVMTSTTSPTCIHVRSSITASGVRDHTVRFQVKNTDDVTNSNGYDFSVASGPPISTDSVRINTGFDAIWKGDGNWNTNANWFAPLPSATKNCQIGLGQGPTDINVTNATCESATLLNGGNIDFLNTNRSINVKGFLEVGDSYIFSNATNGKFVMSGTINQSLAMRTEFPGDLDINNTGAAGNEIIDIVADSSFAGDVRVLNGTLRVGSGTTLVVKGNLTVSNGAQLIIEPGGLLQLSDNSVVTINTGGTFQIVGSPDQDAAISSISTADAYEVVINGNIKASHYRVEHLGVNGFRVNAGAVIDATDHFQNGQFSYPIDNSTQMLRLYRQVPGNAIDSISFMSNGSGATGVTNIYSDSGVGAGTLNITNYSGDLAGETNDIETNYVVNWGSQVTTLDLLAEATTPASMPAGSTQVMGVFSLKLSEAGTFNDTDVTFIKLTKTGTINGADIDEVRLYQNAACNGTGGTLIGTGIVSGAPASTNFALTAGDLLIEDHATAPVKNCFYIEFDINSAASNGLTAGVKVNLSSDLTNSESYLFSGSTNFPTTSGTPGVITASDRTIWIGSVSTDWDNPANWTDGVPNQNLTCEIPFASNNPIITTGTKSCDTIEVTSGSLTMTGGLLQIYGGLLNTGTINQGTSIIEMQDDYSTATDQVISSTSPLGQIRMDKRAGGNIIVGGTTPLQINNLNFTTGESFTFRIPSGKTLEVDNNINIRAGITFRNEGGGTVKVANGRWLQTLGGVLQASGVNDAFPQGTVNKATFTSKSGRFRMRATSGTVNLVGFIIDNLNKEGLRIEGSSNLSNLDGGQFTNMEAVYSGTEVRGIWFNTTATISETVASNVGFMFGPANSVYGAGSPLPTDQYDLVYANNCGNQTLTFDNWFGNFWGVNPQPVTEDKIFDLDDDAANTCQINMDASASPVQLTDLKATPYNGTVDIEWVTASEVNHYGFNVFRSQNANGNLTQVNSDLIRNFQHSHLGNGNYIFRDNQVNNGQTYFYYIEDVGANGSKTMHGPVIATPESGLATAPSYSGSESGTGENNDNNGDGRNPNSLTNGIDLGGGVLVLSQTINSLKIKINPSTMSFNPAVWDGSYNEVAINSYTKTQEVGIAQTLERVLLIEVDPGFTSAQLTNSELSESGVQNFKITPAPDWVLNTGTNILEPQYAEDSTYYALNTFEPNNYFSLEPQLISAGQKKFLKVVIHPIKYNPTTEMVKQATEIVLDIGLDGNAWDWTPPTNTTVVTPEAFSNVLKIKYSKTGMYEVKYEELDSLGLIGPFEGNDTSLFRMYFQGQEVPIEIIGGSQFNAGSSVRFYASYSETLEDDFNEIVLSPQGIKGESYSPKRMNPISSAPDFNRTDIGSHMSNVQYEQDVYFQEDLPVGGHVEHVYWKQLYRQQGVAANAAAQLDINIDLNEIDFNSLSHVNLVASVRGRPAVTFNPTHTLEIYVNSVSVGTVSFESKLYRSVNLQVPTSFFNEGTNVIRLESSDLTTEPGDYNLIDIDKLTIQYPRSNSFYTSQLVINNQQLGENIFAYKFLQQQQVYDVSHPELVFKVTDFEEVVTSGEYAYRFKSINNANIGSAGEPVITGTKFAFVDSTTVMSPAHLDLSSGYSNYLKDTASKADLIIIAPKNLLPATEKIASYRRLQGLSVVSVSLEQIYDEFSSGSKSSQGIKDFLMYAYNNWQRPAVKYAMFVGDATIDFKDKLNYGGSLNKWPARMIHGKHLDFSSDIWFVSPKDEESGVYSNPLISVGRIPSSDAAVLDKYFDKVINYESGSAQPLDSNINSFVFVSDNDQTGEQFNDKNLVLSQILSDQNALLNSSILDRADYATGANLNLDILNKFNNEAPLLMTYFGHGAEDRWGDTNYFNITDISSLSNNNLPMVLALNCVNSNYTSYDDSFKSLGEELILTDHGAVNFFGSSSMTSPGNQMTLSVNFMSEMASTTKDYYKGQRVGDLVFKTQSTFPVNSGNQDVLLSWTFFGDPSMKMPAKAFSGIAPDADSSGDSAGGGCGLVNQPPTSSGPTQFIFFFLLLVPLFIWRRVKESIQ